MNESVAVLDYSPREGGGSYGGSPREDFAVLTPFPVMEARRPDAPMPLDVPPSRFNYIQKRLAAAATSSPHHNHPSMLCFPTSEPLTTQRYYRFRLLGLLAMQLVAVTAVVAVITHTLDLSDIVSRWVSEKPLVLVVWGGITTVLLLVLYIVQHRDRWNAVVLIAFTVAQSLLIAGFGLWMHRVPVGLFVVAGTAGFMIQFTLFSCVRASGSQCNAVDRLCNLWQAGASAFATTLVMSVGCMQIEAIQHCLSWTEWSYSMGFLGVLAMWLVFDANGLQLCLTQPHEYWRGVVYFYTDILLLLALLASLTCVLACGDSGDVICVGPVWCCGGGTRPIESRPPDLTAAVIDGNSSHNGVTV